MDVLKGLCVSPEPNTIYQIAAATSNLSCFEVGAASIVMSCHVLPCCVVSGVGYRGAAASSAASCGAAPASSTSTSHLPGPPLH
jgi:hypothetical protein